MLHGREDSLKDKVATAFVIDATDGQALSVLPLNSVDIVIVAIGENFGASIRVVALLKSQNKNLTTRQIIQILQGTGKPIAASPEIGKLVQIKDALERGKRTPAGRKRNGRRA